MVASNPRRGGLLAPTLFAGRGRLEAEAPVDLAFSLIKPLEEGVREYESFGAFDTVNLDNFVLLPDCPDEIT